MHSHTSYSDGSGTPREAYRHARNEGGLDFLAITEHNHRDAGPRRGDRADGVLIANRPELYDDLIREPDRATEDGRFVAFYGQEFSSISRGNHTNVLMANKVIRTGNGEYRTVFTDQWMNEHGVEVIQLNHPWEGKLRSNDDRFLRLSDLGTAEDGNYGFHQFGSPEAFRRALDGRAFLIKLVNGPALRDADPEHGEIFFGDAEPNWYIAYLNRGLHLAPTGNQDNHYRTWGTINENCTVVLAPALTRAALLQAMMELRVYATEDKDLKVTFTVNGHIMGSRRPPAQGAATTRVTVSDRDEPNSRYLVELFYDRAPGGPPAAVANYCQVLVKGTEVRLRGAELFDEGRINGERAGETQVGGDEGAPLRGGQQAAGRGIAQSVRVEEDAAAAERKVVDRAKTRSR